MAEGDPDAPGGGGAGGSRWWGDAARGAREGDGVGIRGEEGEGKEGDA